MKIDKRQKTLIILIILAATYIFWQVYEIFSSSPAPKKTTISGSSVQPASPQNIVSARQERQSGGYQQPAQTATTITTQSSFFHNTKVPQTASPCDDYDTT